jgi:dihydrofolate reductase
MGKIIMFNLTTIDGFFSGKNGELFWNEVDDEFRDFSAEQLHQASGLIFGRKTYQLMAGYWPLADPIKNDPVVAKAMNALPKIVFSTTLEQAEWNNTTLLHGDLESTIINCKNSGGDFLIFGSADLSATLTEKGLIDEYRIMVHPVTLGEGIPIFKEKNGRLRFSLINTRTFKSGNVLLCYRLKK